MSKYPTKAEIINNLKNLKIYKKEIDTLKLWKKQTWNKVKTLNNDKKTKALKQIILYIAKINNVKNLTIEYNPKLSTGLYNPLKHNIVLNNTSIITALHELGHVLFGPSELTACTYSIKLFQYAFPKAYKKLNWDGHLLIK